MDLEVKALLPVRTWAAIGRAVAMALVMTLTSNLC